MMIAPISSLSDNAAKGGPRARTDQSTLLTVFRKRCRCVVQRGRMERTSFEEMKCAELGFAQARRICQQSVKHGLQFARRTRNDMQHLRGRSLLLQRRGEVGRARLHLVE